jgi:apolipoprotein N-acyltransferase
MVFVHKHPVFATTLSIFATAALLIAGNGMEPRWPLMWIAFVPVLVLAAEIESWLLAGLAAFLSMLLGSLNLLYYMHIVLGAPVTAWLVLFSFASLLFAGGVLLFRGLLHRGSPFSAAIALPAFWTIVEYLASFAPSNGTAGSLAYTQERLLPILQIASVTGPWGITFLLLLFPSAITSWWYLRRRSPKEALGILASVFALLGCSLLFGAIRLAAPTSQQAVQVGLLVTDRVFFAEDTTEMQTLISDYAAQAEKLARAGAKMVLMPEKTGLLREQNTATVDAILQAVADRTGTTLVIGFKRSGTRSSFNEARIYTPKHDVSSYDKQHMLPLFESNLTPGTSLVLLPNFPEPVGVAICKDMDFIRPALDYGRTGIDLLLDPAWDFNVDRTWHGHIAIMRGVEGGYAIAHAAKGGFLTVSDDRGRILGEVRSDSAPFASLLVKIPLHHSQTLFDRLGAWFPWLAGLMLLICIVRCLTGPRPPITAKT